VLVALLLGLTELGLRLGVGSAAFLFPWERGRPLALAEGSGQQDGPYRWEARAGAHGFRVVAENPSAPIQVLVAGDSWAWGWGVTQGRTLADRVAAHLTTLTGTPVGVRSAGRPGADAEEIVQNARIALAQARATHVLLVQPHNARRRPIPGRTTPFKPSPPPPDVAVYRALRYLVAPWTWAGPPRQLDGAWLEEALAAIRGFRPGVPVYLLVTPQERVSATRRAFPPEPEWTGLGQPWAGHRLPDRRCWGWEDAFHPSEAVTDALAQVAAGLVAGTVPSGTWTDTPSCAEAEGDGP